MMGKCLEFILRKIILTAPAWKFFKVVFLRIIADSRITALRIVCMLTSTILWMMMSFLTDTWKFDYTYAAGIRNVWSGLTLALPLILVHVSDTITGDFYMSSLGALLYSTGLGFLSAATPPSSCIGSEGPLKCAEKTSSYLYAGLALTVFGLACIETSLSNLELKDGTSSGNRLSDEIDDLFRNGFTVRTKHVPISCPVSSSSLFTVAFLGMLIPIYANIIKSWHARLLIATIFVSLQTLNFVVAKQTYKVPTGLPSAPEKSLIVLILRVLVASTLNMGHQRETSDQFYMGDDNEQLFNAGESDSDDDFIDSDDEDKKAKREKKWESTSGMKLLEKAAIIVKGLESENDKKSRWRLCTVGEVELTKMVLRMFPLWTTCILIGVVSSIGDTYFLEQASNLDRGLGKFTIPLIALLGVQKIAGFAIVSIFNKVTERFKIRKIILASLGIALAMVFSTLCCILAALIENKRLKVVRANHLVDQQEHDIPMSLFWLVPQFVLLGGLTSMFEQGNTGLSNRFPKRVVRYMALSTTGINGLGRIGGVVSVYLAGRITRGENKESWFQSSLNKSRLDQYYWLLAAMSGIALAAYLIVACWHFYRESSRAVKENEEDHSALIEKCHYWCCG